MTDYLTHLETTEPDYFTHLKSKFTEDADAPKDKDTFLKYAKTISDYSIGRDYMRGGEKRRLYDQLKKDCWDWCDGHYRKRYEQEVLDSGRLLTITLCHFISRLNILAKENQHLVDLLDGKETFRKNAGTPKASQIYFSDLHSARRLEKNLPSLSLQNSSSELKKLSPENQREWIIQTIRNFIGDLFIRDQFNIFKWQKDLPVISLDDTTLTEPFWTDKEDIESLLEKISVQLEKLRKDASTRAVDRQKFLTFHQLINSHKVFFAKHRMEFTRIYREIIPEDFLSPKELEVTFVILCTINAMVQEFIKLLDTQYQDATQRDQKRSELAAFKKQIENHIRFYQNERTNYTSYQQFATDQFMNNEAFITKLIMLQQDVCQPKELIEQLIKSAKSTLTPLELIQYVIKLCAKHLNIDDLKAQFLSLCADKISKEEFEKRFICLCVDDLNPLQLAERLKKACSDLIPPATLEEKLQQLFASSLSDDYMKVELKKCCHDKIPPEQLEERLRTLCATDMSQDYYKSRLIKLSETVLKAGSSIVKRTYPVSSPINIPETSTPVSGADQTTVDKSIKRNSRGVPQIPIPHSPPTTPKQEPDNRLTEMPLINSVISPPVLGSTDAFLYIPKPLPRPLNSAADRVETPQPDQISADLEDDRVVKPTPAHDKVEKEKKKKANLIILLLKLYPHLQIFSQGLRN